MAVFREVCYGWIFGGARGAGGRQHTDARLGFHRSFRFLGLPYAARIGIGWSGGAGCVRGGVSMKGRRVKDKSAGARTLIVRGTRGEQLDYGRAEWLAVRPSPLLLPFKYEIGERRFLFYYDVTGLPTLREYLAMGISGSQYVSLLMSLGKLGDLCSSADLPMEMVRFEPENIYVSGGRMLFCCLPLKPAVQQVSVLDLLKVLADPAKVKFVWFNDRRLAEPAMDCVRRSRVFSAFDFDEFLARRFNAGAVSSVYRDSVSGNLSARQGPSDVVFDPFAGSEVDERAVVALGVSGRCRRALG